MGEKRFSPWHRSAVPMRFYLCSSMAAIARRGESPDTPLMAKSDPTASPRVAAQHLMQFARDAFVQCELPETDAEICAQSLVWADLHGVDTHGVARIPAYVERFRRKLFN